jgi:serine phosphatase RsbU (regulator of sigma subunit)
MRFRIPVFFLFLLCLQPVFCQQKLTDSLIRAIPSALDTNRVEGLIRVSREMVSNNPTEATKYIDQAYELSRSLKYPRGEAIANIGYGLAAYYSDNYLLAEKYFLQAIGIAEKIKNRNILARSYVNMGLANDGMGNYEKAISYYFKGLGYAEQIKDESVIARANNNIGNVYKDEGKFDLAGMYYQRALASHIKAGDKWGIASALNNVGLIFKRTGKRDSCMIYYQKALQLRIELEDKKGEDLVLNNIAGLYLESGEYQEALTRFLSLLPRCQESGDKYLTGLVYNNLAESYLGLKNYKLALIYLDSVKSLSEKLGARELQKEVYKRYYMAYKTMRDFTSALKYYKKYSQLKDTIYNANNQKAIVEMQSRYESQRKEAEIELLHKNENLETARIKHERTLVSSLIGAGILFFLLTGLVYNRSAVKKKANRDLEHQNELIQAQKEEITSSIAYALNIQRSMLPSAAALKAILPEHFILHKPKDIVSGDFYFVEKKGDYVIFSAIDCTGHGVPGALLSFLGMDILQDAVHRKNITEPSELLLHLDAEINLRLRKTTDTDSVRDGMDLAICSLNTRTNELHVAGAFNPVYIVSEGTMEEIKPDKHAIGSNRDSATPIQFTNHVRMLKKGDCVYVLSDGYADQFGGRMGKKFKYKPLKEMLLANSVKSMKEQGELLEQIHLKWKGDMFQVDDILILGIRI